MLSEDLESHAVRSVKKPDLVADTKTSAASTENEAIPVEHQTVDRVTLTIKLCETAEPAKLVHACHCTHLGAIHVGMRDVDGRKPLSGTI